MDYNRTSRFFGSISTTRARLQQFRVHQVEASTRSSILNGRVIIVVDVGDSTLAPHQAAESKIYYFRQGGRSEPAPQFYLETLRIG